MCHSYFSNVSGGKFSGRVDQCALFVCSRRLFVFYYVSLQFPLWLVTTHVHVSVCIIILLYPPAPTVGLVLSELAISEGIAEQICVEAIASNLNFTVSLQQGTESRGAYVHASYRYTHTFITIYAWFRVINTRTAVLCTFPNLKFPIAYHYARIYIYHPCLHQVSWWSVQQSFASFLGTLRSASLSGL